MHKLLIIYFLFLTILSNCSKTNLEKIDAWIEKEDFEKLLEFSNKNKSSLTDEELYLSSVGVSKFQNFLRKNRFEEKYSTTSYYNAIENKIGLKIKIVNTHNGKLPTIEDIYEKSLPNSSYYKNKCLLDRFKFTALTNEMSENSFLLMDILEIDPRLFLQEFKSIWIDAMKLGIPASLSNEAREKFITILHFLASKEETDFRKYFFFTEGTNINLRSGPGIENSNIGKMNDEEVFQIDSDYNTTSIGNKTGKWIQVYVWKTDKTGWIFSPFLKSLQFDKQKALQFEKEISELNNFITIDFNNWNPDQIPDGFYGNYSNAKKKILDANVGFTIYPSSVEQGICKKLKKEIRKINFSFLSEDSSERIIIFYLKGVTSLKSTTLAKMSIENQKISLDAKELDLELSKNKPNNVELNISTELDSKLEFSIALAKNKDFFETSNIDRKEIESWEICIPQGRKSSSNALLFSFTIY